MPIVDANVRAEMFQNITERLQELGDTHTNIGSEILSSLWEIYKNSLWKTEEFVFAAEDMEVISLRFESFVEYCDEVIRTHFDPAEYFDKFKWVVDRVFRYLYLREQQDEPIIIPFSNPPQALTVDLLLETKGWLSKLILISNKFEQCRDDADIERLFFAGIDGTVEEVRLTGEEIPNERIPIHIPYVERTNGSNYNLFFENITEEQYDILRKKMGRILEVHFD
jgi:hypothetical protein